MKQVCVRQKPVSHAFVSKIAAPVALILGVGAAPAFAHHSGAMFDNAKTITLTGAVTEFKWMNPHGSIELMASEPGGQPKLWSIELSTPNILVRHGWSAHSLKPGDMVSLTAHPMRDGGAAGMVLAVTAPGGAVLKDHDY
jgi:hypothetical protein